MSRERERMQSEQGPVPSDSADINTKVYKTVKGIWVKRDVWNRKWGILPGMSWKHEQPLEEMLAEEIGPPPVPEPVPEPPAPRRNIFGSSPPPVEPNFSSAAGPSKASEGDPPVDVDANASQNSSASHTPPRPRRGESPPSQENRRAQSLAAPAALGPIYPAKVSKASTTAAGGRNSGLRRRSKASSNFLRPDAQRALPELDSLEEQSPVPASVTPLRRSRRLQNAKANLDARLDAAADASQGRANGSSGSGLKKSTGGQSRPSISAKPKGVSKRPPPRTNRHPKSQ